MTKQPRHYVIDDLARVLRKPSAAPTITPAEVIAIVLTTTQWTPGRAIHSEDVVVQSILKCMEDAGWKFEPL